jgi:sugar phosphate isomerase/epimerase
MILGMKVRKHDIKDMLKFNSKILEFHFSDSDLNLILDRTYENQLMVHCYEYFDRKIVDMVSLKETHQIHSKEKSIELVQAAIDKTVELNEHFVGTPSIIVHPGGYSLEELSSEDIQLMKNTLHDSVKQLDTKNIHLLLENMPPYGWFYGGRWNSNIFLDSSDLLDYCKNTKNKVCFDLCHSQLYCNKQNISFLDQLEQICDYTSHFHLSDAEGSEEEGLQYGEGTLPFKEVIPILNRYPSTSFAIEVWKGHEEGGKGFGEFLDKINKEGLDIT